VQFLQIIQAIGIKCLHRASNGLFNSL